MFQRPSPQTPNEPEMTRGARDVLGHARAEAAALHHHYLGTEHILLGLLRDASSGAGQLLASRIDLETVRDEVGKVVGVGAEPPHDELPLTPHATETLALAKREADMYHESLVAPEHLLLGILREGEGIAVQVLLDLRVDLGDLRAATSRALGEAQAPSGILPPTEPTDD